MTRLLTNILFWTALAALASQIPGCAPPPPGRFVVLVVMDTVRRDALGCYGGAPTPAIDALATDGVRFERALATSGWTLPSVASLLTSTWPSVHGALGRGKTLSPLRGEVATAAEIMRAAGFRTAAYANAAFVSPRLGLDRGFEVFDHAYTFTESARRADDTVDAAVAWIREHRGDDCFVLVHLFDAHLDYDPPDSADVAYIRGVYQGEVAFVDEQVGRLIGELKSLGVYERSFVVATADHGEEFWDHGEFGHGHTLYDELVRVPLVIKFPRDLHPARRTVSWQVSLIDVVPTVLDYFAVEPPATFEGRSLLSFVRGEPRGHASVLGESILCGSRRISWRTSRYVYIQDIEEGRDELGELYDWRADPLEQHDLSEVQPDIAAHIKDECMSFYADLLERARTMSELQTIDMSPEEVERLRSLGCIR